MQFFHISIGGGITGVETIISTINRIEKIIKSKKKKIKSYKSLFSSQVWNYNNFKVASFSHMHLQNKYTIDNM